jgi:pimeloyl-ACP methyl ester carboxylesterase
MMQIARRIAISIAGAAVAATGGTYALKRSLEAEFPVSVEAVLAGRPCLDDEHVKMCVLSPVHSESGRPRRRTISYREYGSEHAQKTVIVLHAPGSSRLQLSCSGGEPLDFSLKRDSLPSGWQSSQESPAERHGIRVIAIDRPGYGSSTDDAPVPPEHALKDTAALVRDVATELGIKEFGVVGLGGAGAYALACARYLPQELSEFAPDAPTLRGVAVVSLEGPWKRQASTDEAEVAAIRAKAELMNEMEGISGKAMAKVCKELPWVADVALMVILRGLTKDPDAAAAKILEAMDKECSSDAKALRRVFSRSQPAMGGGDAEQDLDSSLDKYDSDADITRPGGASVVPAALDGVGVLGAGMFEGVRRGLAGVKGDALALGGQQWGFSLSELTDDPLSPESRYDAPRNEPDVPARRYNAPRHDPDGGGPVPFVSLWCGDKDEVSSPDWSAAAHRESNGPGSPFSGTVELHRVPEVGHVGLIADHWGDILERLGERL